jgi:ankyrin repeat protein
LLYPTYIGATIDARTHAGLTALHLASECGHTGVVCALLDHNRGPSMYNSKASIDTIESATSSSNGHTKGRTLDVNSWTTVENFTALHVAAHSGHIDLIEILLSKYKVLNR